MSDEELLDEVLAAADSQFDRWPGWKKDEARVESDEPTSPEDRLNEEVG